MNTSVSADADGILSDRLRGLEPSNRWTTCTYVNIVSDKSAVDIPETFGGRKGELCV